ncbi:MAG: hypothetical protein M1818_007160 [Claussenomyces sp. TS43310]|nr:MAG: hypothetical protein M1818_007160 [Claussenomyces sp. TS43310]
MVLTHDPLDGADLMDYLDDYDPMGYTNPFTAMQSGPPQPFGTDPLRLSNDAGDDYASSQRTRFKFKSSKRMPDGEARHRSSPHGTDSQKSRQHGHTKKRRKEPKASEKQPPQGPPSSEQDLDPDVAFRESLFDAMADDEGAAFWEGVYGQPIPQVAPVKEGPAGALEAMTDEEYAAHVRAEMYKKTHQYMFEERARRDEARKGKERLAEQQRRADAEAESLRRQVDESLRSGQQRKSRLQRSSEWAQKWKLYEKGWEMLSNSASTTIPWPVWSGVKNDIKRESIETFFLNGPTSGKPDLADLPRILKVERVRWHPDKIQQKFGGQGLVDESKMRGVTAVFQIIDHIWTELRDKRA